MSRLATAGLLTLIAFPAVGQAQMMPGSPADLEKIEIRKSELQVGGMMGTSVLFELLNNSSRSFSMVGVECRILRSGETIASAEGVVTNITPGTVAASDAYTLTNEAHLRDADDATCRVTMGM